MRYFKGDYSCSLNSHDKIDPELGLIQNRARGGTMVLWKNSLDQYISVFPVHAASFLPIIFSPPASIVSIHIGIYLPTSGRESQFLEESSKLRLCLDELGEKYPDSPIFIRGDSNVNKNHSERVRILNSLANAMNLASLPIPHKTYHHFLGHGAFDSSIDIIMLSKTKSVSEQILDVFCKFDHPMIQSHHDIILSSCSLPASPQEPLPAVAIAPRIENTRTKVLWSESSIEDYKSLVSNKLDGVRERWLNPESKSSVSILLRTTSEILTKSAESTQNFIKLKDTKPEKSTKVPYQVKKAKNRLKSSLKLFKRVDKNDLEKVAAAKDALDQAKKTFRSLHRNMKHRDVVAQSEKLFSILSGGSSKVHHRIKSSKSTATLKIPFLSVGSEKFEGDLVPDGFFQSITSLKTQDKDLRSSPAFKDYNEDYTNILEICRHKKDIPEIPLDKSTAILMKMRPSVTDFYSMTTQHYINAGHEGLLHFNFLLNCIISDLNNSTVEELNNVYALLLHKGHGKIKTDERSYRTISTCPLLSKALDLYLRDLHAEKWQAVQADTQYLGEGSSHELAAVLVTELIQHSIHVSKQPLFLLFLDARSAFDTVVPEMLIRNLYLSGMDGDSLIYVNNRLTSRKTFIDWNKTVMGPIHDQHGVEQGGANSGDLYKIYNNELFETAQNTNQGVDLGNDLVISAVGQADDSALSSNSITNLHNILHIVMNYCDKYSVKISHEKTRLLVYGYHEPNEGFLYNPISIKGNKIPFSEEAEHLGIIRSVEGNLPNVLNRILAHKKAMGAVLSQGLAQSHRSNPAASLKVQQLHGTPVLMSGLASLVLLQTELNSLNQHYKDTIQHLQKLHPKTPSSVIYFLAGTLPATAVLHLRHIGLFGMITRLPNDPLNSLARNALTCLRPSSKSWFWIIRDICVLYSLPHPPHLLSCPLPKEALKKLAKSKVTDYWEVKLRAEAAILPSLRFFLPEYMSLAKPHPLWTSTNSNPYEVAKAVQQARFLSGRYRTESLCRHWTSNKMGLCLSSTCKSEETIEHILMLCPAYQSTRESIQHSTTGLEEVVGLHSSLFLKHCPALQISLCSSSWTVLHFHQSSQQPSYMVKKYPMSFSI